MVKVHEILPTTSVSSFAISPEPLPPRPDAAAKPWIQIHLLLPDGTYLPVTALFDSGTCPNLLSPLPGHTIGNDPILSKLCTKNSQVDGSTADVSGVGGGGIPDLQAYTVPIRIGNINTSTVFFVTQIHEPSLPQAIIGLSFMANEAGGASMTRDKPSGRIAVVLGKDPENKHLIVLGMDRHDLP
jgi:hypothetical protein